jgi:hypothetical protein
MITVGAYVGNDPRDLADFESWLGKSADHLLFYFNQSSWPAYDSSIDWAIDLWKHTSATIIWSVPLVVDGSTLEAAAAGAYDSHYLKAAKSLLVSSTGDKPIHIRTGWEFNGEWFPWSARGHESAFIAAYRNLVDTFRSVSDRFIFEWTANIGGAMNPATAYPGDNYVDFIGMDFYYNTLWDSADPIEAWNSMVYRPYGLQWHQDFAAQHNKPTAYSEWGIMSNNAGPYIEKAAEWFDKYNVAYNAYWETDYASYPGTLHDGRYPNAGTVYREVFGSSDHTRPPLVDTSKTVERPDTPVKSDEPVRWFIGTEQNDTLVGSQESDYINGQGGDDLLVGQNGNDIYVVDSAHDRIVEASGRGTDKVDSWANTFTLPSAVENLNLSGSYKQTGIGNALNNKISGGSGANVLNGRGGNDILSGGLGKDTMTGEIGRDVFVFNTKPTAGNADKIVDFNVKDDAVWLDNQVFTKLGKGTESKPAKLSKTLFKVGAKAKDKNDYIVYDKTKGALYYDADGSGSKYKPVEIAKVSKNIGLSYNDIFII